MYVDIMFINEVGMVKLVPAGKNQLMRVIDMQWQLQRTALLLVTYRGKFHMSVLLFLRREGTIICEVTGTRRYSVDLPQGGLEIPCKLFFTAEALEVDKLHMLLK